MMRERNPVVDAGVLDNAEWCDLMCRAHGFQGVRTDDVWVNLDHRLQAYPHLMTLHPRASADTVLGLLGEMSSDCFVKDSFASLELSAGGFRVLFEAQWIHRAATLPTPAAAEKTQWAAVRTVAELAQWCRAAGTTGLFPDSLLREDAVLIIGGREEGRVVAGAVVTVREGAVGVSNVFGLPGRSAKTWAGVIETVARHVPDLPIVGYEKGDELSSAMSHGFEPLAPLRVWMRAARTHN